MPGQPAPDADPARRQRPARVAARIADYAGPNEVLVSDAAVRSSGMDEDEFIDDIPFPETQNYVKRILGTAEDYRLLYGRDGGRPRAATELRR